MRVFRVENNLGHGPYRSNTPLCKKIAVAHFCDKKRPSVWEDIRKFEQKHVCGFKTLYQLFSWFEGFVDDLATDGFKISIYEVDFEHVRFGTYQLCFDKSESVMIERMGFDALIANQEAV